MTIKLLDLNAPIETILLTFAKTFDKICHHQLKTKLMAIGTHLKVVEGDAVPGVQKVPKLPVAEFQKLWTL